MTYVLRRNINGGIFFIYNENDLRNDVTVSNERVLLPVRL